VKKIPVRLISPGTLLEITKNVSLTLPAGYQLVAGTSPASMPWYYELVKTTMVASTQGFLLVLSLPLTDSSKKFDLVKIHTFPYRLFNNTFVQYQVGREYLAVNLLQHTYFTMTERERQQCQGLSLKVCPVSRPVYSTQVENCALSLYFQRPSVRELCSRNVKNQQPPPILLRSGQVLLYHFAEPRRVFVRCPQQQDKSTTSWVLRDAGVINHAARCHVTTEGVQLYPLLDGESTFEGQAPMLFAPTLPEIVSQDEFHALRELSEEATVSVQGKDFSVRSSEADVGTLLDIHSARSSSIKWQTPILLGVVGVMAVGFVYLTLHARLIKLCTFRAVPSNPDLSPSEAMEAPRAAPRYELSTVPGMLDGTVSFVKHSTPVE
jgi:hypothetical protein